VTKPSNVASLPAVKAVLSYLDRGFPPVAVTFGGAAAIGADWGDRVVTRDNAASLFRGRVNVGLMLGRGDGPVRLTDVDIDCAEALRIADAFLPPTAMVSGRAGNPRSHRWYLTSLFATETVATVMFKDPVNGAMLLEIRCGGGGSPAQTVVPPSKHESGEAVVWHDDGDPATAEGAALKRTVCRWAAATLFGRYWPEGYRNQTALKLDGWLARNGWTQSERADFIEQVARAAGDDAVKNRRDTTKRTDQKLADDKKVPGYPALCEALGGHGKVIVNQAAEWLDIKRADEADFRLHLLDAAGLVPKLQQWLWQGRIPRGALTLLIGLPDVGKSHIFLDICARVTTASNMPGSTEPSLVRPLRVLIVCTEDRVEYTLVPRLMAAGADLSRVTFVRYAVAGDGTRRGVDLTQDVARIQDCLEQHPDIALVVFDPISEFLGQKIDSHNNSAVRAVLGQLMDLLDKRDVAALCISHLPKMKTGAVQTASIGSVGFSACARSSLLVMDEEEDELDDDGEPTGKRELTGRKLLAVNKGNLAPPEDRHTLALRLEPKTLNTPYDDITVARVKWEGAVALTARDLWQDNKPKRTLPKDAAVAFIKKALRDPDQPGQFRNRASAEAEAEAEAEAAGISVATLRRARGVLGVESKFVKVRNRFEWLVPPRWLVPKPPPPRNNNF
jgi:AAA domain/Bifunctional DNA primase/polymerase, N-terminal